MILLDTDEISLALGNQGYTDVVYAELEVVAKAQLGKFIAHIEAKTSDGVFLSDILKEALKEIE